MATLAAAREPEASACRTTNVRDGASRRRLRRRVRARRAQLSGLDRAGAYAQIREEAGRGDFGPVPAGEGWLHEDFHLADKDAAFVVARSGGHIGADDLVAASRLYTPTPIVDFILQNTLGALWLRMHPDSPLAAAWRFLVPEAIGPACEPRPLRQLRLIDPCCGSGAFLGAAFAMFVALADDERRAARSGNIPRSWCLEAGEVGRHLVAEALWGADLDPDAVAIARRELADAAGGFTAEHVTVVDGPIGSLDPDVWAGERFDVVCTNPPWIGFRQLDGQVKRRVSEAVPLAVSDLAVATLARCQDLVADGGMVGAVTPAAWLAGRDALALRERIMNEGGPVCVAQLGQGIFSDAPLVFVAISVIGRGWHPARLTVLRGRAGAEADGLEALMRSRRNIDRGTVEALGLRPFMPAAPDELLRLASNAARRIGDVASTFDGVWTGDNRRDLRYWWELDALQGWAPLSGGQGYQPWVAPINLRIREEHRRAQPARDSCLEYARVAGGRLGVRIADGRSASLAGVVTIVPVDDDWATRAEILAICNSVVGAAWVATLTAGLNFNPGYLAQIPIGTRRPDEDFVAAVDAMVALRGELITRDPSHDGFVDVVSPWRDDLPVRLAMARARLEEQVGHHLGLDRSVLAQLDPVVEPRPAVGPYDDLLLVAVLRALGFTWPGQAPPAATVLEREDLVEVVADTLHAAQSPDGAVDPAAWVHGRLATVARSRFRRSSPIMLEGSCATLVARTAGVR